MKKRLLAGAVSLATSLSLAGLAGPVSTAGAATTTPLLRVMPLGDSITWGQQSSTGNGYRQQLWNDLTGEHYTVDFVGGVKNGNMTDPDNEGYPGWRIDAIAGIADNRLATYKPNVVTIELGTNDLNQNHDVTNAPARLSALVDQVFTDDPTTVVIVASVIISNDSKENAILPAYNNAIQSLMQQKQAAGKHVEYVSMSAITQADLSDTYHPGDAGYNKMGDSFNGGIQAAVNAGWIATPAANGGAIQGHTGGVASGVAGKCLDDFGGSNANGTKIEIWGCNGTGAQQFTAYSDGTLRVEGKCLDINAFGTANGTQVSLWDCNGGANQVWQAYNGGYLNPYSGRCLDDPGYSATDGTAVNLWDCNGGSNQKWTTLQRD